MKKLRIWLGLLCLCFLVTITKIEIAQAAEAWILDSTDEANKTSSQKVTISYESISGVPVIIIDWLLPWPNVRSLTSMSAGEKKIKLMKKRDGMHASLSAGQGHLKIESKDKSFEIKYRLKENSSPLILDPGCLKAGLKAVKKDFGPSSFAALMVCKKSDETYTEIIFSNLQDAEWFGTDAFEISGKGERYKIFLFNDTRSLKSWSLNWGSEEQKNQYQILIPEVYSEPSVVLSAGLGFLSGNFTSGNQSSLVSGLIVPFRVNFKKPDASWFIGGGYDFFAYALTRTAAGSPSTSTLEVWVGLEQKKSWFTSREKLSYFNRSFLLPDQGLSGTFQSPKLNLELIHEFKKSSLGFGTFFAQTASGGSYSETGANLSYIFNRLSRASHYRTDLSFTQSSSSVDKLSLNTQIIGINFGLDF